MIFPEEMNRPNTIKVQECSGWFDVVIRFADQSDIDRIFSKIPKSYRMRIQKSGDGRGNWERIISVHIVLKPTELTGSKNEIGLSRITKIKQKLKELLPHFRVYTILLRQVSEQGRYTSATFAYDRIVEGWV